MEMFAKYIKEKDFSFKYAKGMRDIVGREIHPYHEIFFYIGGEAHFICEEKRYPLLPCTTVVIPRGTFHQFVVTGKESDYCRCVFKFEAVSELDEMIERRMSGIFLLQSDKVTQLFLQARDLYDAPMGRTEKDTLLKALFAQILVYLGEPTEYAAVPDGYHALTRTALELINRRIGVPLSVGELASELYVSPSYLAHIFKRDLLISIHRYILEKRLIQANERIQSGEKPTAVAAECGFQNYSAFYRQYKRMFGVSPAKTKDGRSET